MIVAMDDHIMYCSNINLYQSTATSKIANGHKSDSWEQYYSHSHAN